MDYILSKEMYIRIKVHMKISGNTILITGGDSSIRLELATQLLALKNTAIITERDQIM
jgi:short-subunit dehydrogenase involved in D-alanine esterification of teichoic acids